jgi:hypothetical protein
MVPDGKLSSAALTSDGNQDALPATANTLEPPFRILRLFIVVFLRRTPS